MKQCLNKNDQEKVVEELKKTSLNIRFVNYIGVTLILLSQVVAIHISTSISNLQTIPLWQRPLLAILIHSACLLGCKKTAECMIRHDVAAHRYRVFLHSDGIIISNQYD